MNEIHNWLHPSYFFLVWHWQSNDLHSIHNRSFTEMEKTLPILTKQIWDVWKELVCLYSMSSTNKMTGRAQSCFNSNSWLSLSWLMFWGLVYCYFCRLGAWWQKHRFVLPVWFRFFLIYTKFMCTPIWMTDAEE